MRSRESVTRVKSAPLKGPEHPTGDKIAKHSGRDERNRTHENGNAVARFIDRGIHTPRKKSRARAPAQGSSNSLIFSHRQPDALREAAFGSTTD
jgi:hypothetical protein